jgi:ribosomal-protein-alanine N-acetyltransferase
MSDLFVFDKFPILETERLILREITADDVEGIIAMYGDTETMEIIEWCAQIFRDKSGLRWGITLKGNDNLIGTCGYHYWLPQHRRAEIGYDLARQYWRQGIMTEAARVMLQFGFERMNLYRIEADVTVGNDASAALLEKLNFKREGLWRHRVFARQQFWDLRQFGLLKDDTIISYDT